jgi:hypothetical protein
MIGDIPTTGAKGNEVTQSSALSPILYYLLFAICYSVCAWDSRCPTSNV